MLQFTYCGVVGTKIQKDATNKGLKDLAGLIEAQGADGKDAAAELAAAEAAELATAAAAEPAAAEAASEGSAEQGAASEGSAEEGDSSYARGAEVAALQEHVRALSARVEQLEARPAPEATPESDETAGTEPQAPPPSGMATTQGDWAAAQDVADLTESLARTDDNLAQLTGIVNDLSDRASRTQDELDALMHAVSKRVAALNTNRLGSLAEALDGEGSFVPDALKSGITALSLSVDKSVEDLKGLSDTIAAKFPDAPAMKAAMDTMVSEAADELNALQTYLAADMQEQGVAAAGAASLEVLASGIGALVAEGISGVADGGDLINGEDSVAVLQAIQDMKGRNAKTIGDLQKSLHEAVMAAVENLPDARSLAGNGVHTDIELHERELRVAEKRLAKLELWVADQNHDDDEDGEEGEAIAGEGASAGAGGGGQMSGDQLLLVKSQGEAIKVLKRRVRTAETELEGANSSVSNLQEELAALRAYAEQSVRELQEAQMADGGVSTVDNSTTVVRYDGKALWKEELEGELEVLNDRIANVERILLDGSNLLGRETGHAVEREAGAAEAPKAAPEPQQSTKGFDHGSSLNKSDNQSVGEKYLRAAGEGEIIRRVQAMERAIASLSKGPKTVAVSPEKPGRRKRTDGAEFARLQSQIRDLQTALSLIKRQLADTLRTSGRRNTGSGFMGAPGKTGMLLGTRCMACDNPINVRKSNSAVPNMNHSSFQPYAAIPVAEDKKTNHPFPGRTRAMTESPSVEDMRHADVQGVGQSSRTHDGGNVVMQPKHWYDDDPRGKAPAVDLAKTETIGPNLKQGGYRRAKAHDRAGSMRSTQGGLAPI